MKFLVLGLVFFLPSLSWSQAPVSVKTLFLKIGLSAPVFSDWGDSQAGFKPSANFSAMFVKDIDEGLSYGVETGYDLPHKNRKVDMDIAVFNLSPVLFSWLSIPERKYYVYAGPGVYHWSRKKNASFESASSTEFGFKAGGGIVKKISASLSYTAEVRWEYLFDMSGKNINIDSANNIIFSLGISKRI